jgi:Mg-chelatase subunit ChlD
LNIDKSGDERYPNDDDRVLCAEHFNSHIQKAVRGETEMKGKRVGMADFTKIALDLINSRSNVQAEKDLLNSQWRDNSSQNGALGKMIAMVDVSGSMDGDPMNVAISLGIRIAEKSALGKRVMTFSITPTWVNLEPYTDFISQVEVLKRAPWGMNTNFYAALDLILDAIIQNKMAPEDVEDMVLVILSDMQIDEGDRSNKESLYETMKAKYEAAGIRVHGKGYKPPHILFWNLRSTSGFPTLSNQPNASMMSGFSPSLLNLFCDQGLTALQSCTPWSLLNKSLENERYTIMGNKLNEEILL